MSARADLCGGRSEMIVPTATSARFREPLLRFSESQILGNFSPSPQIDRQISSYTDPALKVALFAAIIAPYSGSAIIFATSSSQSATLA